MRKIGIIGAASGLGAQIIETCIGPTHMQSSSLLKTYLVSTNGLYWRAMIKISESKKESFNKINLIADWSLRLAKETYDLVQMTQNFVVLGGDHSCAIGTWSGVAYARRDQGDIGLIWIDAHLDGHTFATSISGAIHGMPVAALLGYGETKFTQIFDQKPKLKPKHICVIGARSYEKDEYDLLIGLGVRIFFMPEVKRRGFAAIFAEAVGIVSKACGGFGISIDLDAIDPKYAPAVGSPEPNGLSAKEITKSLTTIRSYKNFLGLEIAEFNPMRDQKQATEKIICDLIKATYAKPLCE